MLLTAAMLMLPEFLSGLIPYSDLEVLGLTVRMRGTGKVDREMVTASLGERDAMYALNVRILPEGAEPLFSTAWEEEARRARYPAHQGTPSGLPLGTDSRYDRPETTWVMLARTTHERVSMSASVHVEGVSEVARDICESSARYLLSGLAAHRSGTPRQTTKNGMSGRFTTDEKTSVELVSARDWAHAHGWSYRFNSKSAVAAMDKGSRTVLIPLAAMKIKDGSNWVEMPDISRKVGDQIFVPATALEGLRVQQ